ncbi:olfactory receptor 6-like [Microcaecilia unicolor]|uniref:Olfactory receptor n=1 Tax=Microcaecilia unicolor TaxID=1415580 RepID=A0A6P7X1D3_9AMPH|nr:olfactory receptor 6-like [Microcaecilia unicolor]XP_030043959.1 olfactory receptor 6-like [Microcaecilia unicolor]
MHGRENTSTVTEFIILGFPEFPGLQIPLFLLFLLVYLIIVMGNLTIITVTCLDPRLHTPMYFFLGNLAFLDISYASVTVPNLLDIFRTSQHISAVGCFTQMHFFIASLCIEYVLLTVMAYDRYVAICHPLRYTVIMNPRTCVLMVAGTWIFGFLEPVAYTVFISRFSFCGSYEINHFFCDLSALLKLSCTSTSSVDRITYVVSVFVAGPCLTGTLTSYVYVISSILRIRSSEGRRKAFSTCSSHLTVVTLFYVSVLWLYLRPSSVQSMNENKIIAVLYNVLIPMFNPLIYTLNNKAVKEAVRKLFTRNVS